MFRKKKKHNSRRYYGQGYNFHHKRGLVASKAPSRFKNSARNKKISLNKVITFVFFVLFLYVVYYFFYSPNFKITEIEIRGRENISEYALKNIIEEQFNSSRFLIFSQDNIIMFNKRLAKKNIKNSYVLEDLKLNKEYPRKLYIEIKEKVSTVVWTAKSVDQQEYYYLDLNGVVLGEIPILEIEKLYSREKLKITEGEDTVKIEDRQKAEGEENQRVILPLIEDKSGSEVKIKEQVLDSKAIYFIIELYEKFPQEFPEISIKNFATPEPNSSRVHLVTEGGLEIYFESTKDLVSQLHNLKLALENKIKDLKKIQYIDLRFDDRVYYK